MLISQAVRHAHSTGSKTCSYFIAQAVRHAHDPSFFCSLLVNNEPTTLFLEELKFEEMFFLCINIDRASKMYPPD